MKGVPATGTAWLLTLQRTRATLFVDPRTCARHHSGDPQFRGWMMAGQHHRDPDYVRAAWLIRRAAEANTLTSCWRCGRTLDQHPPHKDGTRPHWQAGHTIDGDNRAPLAAEASTCNSSAGATAGNLARATDLEAEKARLTSRWR